jgi:hypothetical protein
MLDEHNLTLHEANEAKAGVHRLSLTRRQRFRLRLYLGFAKVLRWCRLI